MNATLDESNVRSSEDSLNILINSNVIKDNVVQLRDSSNTLGVQTPQSINEKEEDGLTSYDNINKTLGYINSRETTSNNYKNINPITNSNVQSNIDPYLKSKTQENIAVDGVTVDAYAEGQSELSNIYSNLDYLYKKSADDRNLVNVQIASQSPTSDIGNNLNYLYEKNTANDLNTLANVQIASQNPILDIGSNLNNLWERSTTGDHSKANVRVPNRSPRSVIDTNLDYLYEKSTSNDHISANVWVPNQSPRSDVNINLNYLYEKNTANDINTLANVRIANRIPASNTDIRWSHSAKGEDFDGLYAASEANLNYLYQSAKLSEGKKKDAENTASSINLDLNSVIGDRLDNNKENSQLSIPLIYYSDFQKYLSYRSSGSSPVKNYAIVIGINTYSDRNGLHASVNDADNIASVLKSLDYDVIELTDQTENKPTKHNILDGALKELSLKKDIGKALIYFSGHGEVDDKNNFYLVPQNGNGNPASYIDEKELNSYITGIKNLTIIIDSCNSGAFKAKAGEGQVILTSSKDDEPSNEKWTEPVSVFTYFLCQAIKDEGQSNREILIQSCFNEAYKKTVQWSSSHLLSQTPMLTDNTNGRYYLS
jgi:hypothetical protein